MRYVLAPRVKYDLKEIADWIAEDNPARAIAMVKELRADFKKIAQKPLHYQLRSDIGEQARLAVMSRCFGSMAMW